MELNKRFVVEITRAIPESETGYNTYIFPCGNSIDKEDSSFGYSGQYYRGDVRITETQGAYKDNCNISIYGLSVDKLTELTFITWNPIKEVDPRNTVKVIVNDQTVYQGNTYRVFADFSEAPEVCLRITGVVGTYLASRPQQDTEIKATQQRTVGNVFTELGNLAGVNTVVNVSVKDNICPDITLSGSLYNQIATLAKSLGLQFDLAYGYLRVSSKDEVLGFSETDTIGSESRSTSSKDEVLGFSETDTIGSESRSTGLPIINLTNGLVGYPVFNNRGVNFRAIFDPKIRPGNIIELDSIVPQVRGRYRVAAKSSTLSTLPNGQWIAEYVCNFLPKNTK